MAVLRLLESQTGAPAVGAPALGEGLGYRVLRGLAASCGSARARIAGRRLDGVLQPAQSAGSRACSAVGKLERAIGRIAHDIAALGLALDEPQAALRGLSGGLLNGRHIDHSLGILLTLRVIITRLTRRVKQRGADLSAIEQTC